MARAAAQGSLYDHLQSKIPLKVLALCPSGGTENGIEHQVCGGKPSYDVKQCMAQGSLTVPGRAAEAACSH